jgi:hypothetical protein
MDPAKHTFAAMFAGAARDKARGHGYPLPEDNLILEWIERIPLGVRVEIGRGLQVGLVLPVAGGHEFRLAGLAETKGPYKWFSANRAGGGPGPNWEYFYHVAEFLRLRRLLAAPYEVRFEDGLMDISVRQGDRLLWYVEVKAKAAGIEPLLRGVRGYSTGLPLVVSDRGNDSLRKAKYLVRHQPLFLTIIGGEERRHFNVRVGNGTFELLERESSPEAELYGNDLTVRTV